MNWQNSQRQRHFPRSIVATHFSFERVFQIDVRGICVLSYCEDKNLAEPGFESAQMVGPNPLPGAPIHLATLINPYVCAHGVETAVAAFSNMGAHSENMEESNVFNFSKWSRKFRKVSKGISIRIRGLKSNNFSTMFFSL